MQAATLAETEDAGSCKKPRYLESMASGDSQSSGESLYGPMGGARKRQRDSDLGFASLIRHDHLCHNGNMFAAIKYSM